MRTYRDQTFALQSILRGVLGIALASGVTGACGGDPMDRLRENTQASLPATDSGSASLDAGEPAVSIAQPASDAGTSFTRGSDAGSTPLSAASGSHAVHTAGIGPMHTAGIGAAIGGAGSGGQGQAGAAGMPTPTATPSLASCDDKTWQMFTGIKPAESFDYATVRLSSQGLQSVAERSSVGTACATSTSLQCQRDLSKALETEGLVHDRGCNGVGPCAYFVVTTKGDAVKRYSTREELLDFLGELDCAQDIFWLLDYDGYIVHCSGGHIEDPVESGWTSSAVETADGYEVTVLELISDCPRQFARVTLSVSRSGEVTVLHSVPIDSDGSCA